MTKRHFLIDLDLSQPLQDIELSEDYSLVRGLVILGRETLGEVELPVKGGCCSAADQGAAIAYQFSDEILLRGLSESLATGQWHPDQGWAALLGQKDAGVDQHFEQMDVFAQAAQREAAPKPASLAVAICWSTAQGEVTVEHLADCFAGLRQSLADHAQASEIELIVVGPARHEASVRAAAESLSLQYSVEESGELAAQRRQAIAASHGEGIAFLSPQVRVGVGWISAIARQFQEVPDVAVITGPLLARTHPSAAWETLKDQSLMMPSFARWWYRQSHEPSEWWQQVHFHHPIPEQNVAFRRAALQAVLAQDGLEGSEAIANSYCLTFAQMAQGHSLCVEPAMWARDSIEGEERLKLSAAREAERLGEYFAWGSLTDWPIPRGYRPIFLKESLGGLSWYGRSGLRQSGLAKQFCQIKLKAFAAALQTAVAKTGSGRSLKRMASGLSELIPNRSSARSMASQSTADSTAVEPSASRRPETRQRMASRSLDLGEPLSTWNDLTEYDAVRIFVTHGQAMLGHVDLWHNRGVISARQISQQLVRGLRDRLLTQAHRGHSQTWQALELQVAAWLQPDVEDSSAEEAAVVPQGLPLSVPVSVIITTCDRPKDLRNCLTHLLAQESEREFEIVVADNRPASGITPAVLQAFPSVKLVSESRVGGSYGRNAAFCASTGEIIVTIDDDVVVPPDWLERLLVPMARPEVLVVTGNVLPLELETEAQRLYEDLYGGLGQGLERFEVNEQWLNSFSYSPPVWELGVSANSAFRASVFHNPRIGMMPEELGPGTPVGSGEENYLIYRILRAGGTLVYEPSAYVWHRHRRTLPELRYQIYRQMMSSTGYHLRLLTVDGDSRAKRQLLRDLPRYLIDRVGQKIKGTIRVPWRFIWAESAGYLMGFSAYYQSLKAVKRQGRSEPYVPVRDRPADPFLPACNESSSQQAGIHQSQMSQLSSEMSKVLASPAVAESLLD